MKGGKKVLEEVGFYIIIIEMVKIKQRRKKGDLNDN